MKIFQAEIFPLARLEVVPKSYNLPFSYQVRHRHSRLQGISIDLYSYETAVGAERFGHPSHRRINTELPGMQFHIGYNPGGAKANSPEDIEISPLIVSDTVDISSVAEAIC